MNLKIKNLKVKLNDSQKKDREIVSDANFELSAGEIILLNGENGSGKSSLLSAIFKHPNYNIEDGKIILEDEVEIELTNLKTFEIARHGLYLSLQHVPEIEGVNLLQFLYRSYKNVSEDNNLSVLDFNKELLNFCDKYEINQDFLKRDLNVGFSGGEKKQAEMLHLFALKPKFVFMDEIDSGVDKEAIKKVFKIINYFNKEYKMAFCIISHREGIEDLVEISRHYEMREGKLNLC
jgi:Fe-S cluster assembly ATP-binding protein